MSYIHWFKSLFYVFNKLKILVVFEYKYYVNHLLRTNLSDVKLLGVYRDQRVVHPHLPESAGHLLGETGHPTQAKQLHCPPEAVGVRGLARGKA